MSNWLREWEEKQRKEWSCETYEDLVIHASRSLSFIEGQLQYGVYDSQDIFGECGHVANLYLIQEVIFQKAQEQGIQNPYDAFAESYELQCHRVTGPKPLTPDVFHETCKEAEEEMAKEADDYSPEGEWFDK